MIEIKNVSKSFTTDNGVVNALKDVTITIPTNDIFGIIGVSGAGKSTLVRCINMLERPTSGSVVIDDVDIGSLSPKELRLKRRDIAMIFQHFNLLMQKNCLKNICFPLELAGKSKAEATARAMELLEIVGLKDKAKAYPAELSGGQKQRIAIARALANEPKVLLCDEATSALDPTTTNSILDLIQNINETMGITVVMITHQMEVVEKICKHVAILDHGVVAEQGDVSEIFSRPKSEAAKKMVFPEIADGEEFSLPEGSQLIQILYKGADATEKPMISRLALEKGIEASIVYASTRHIKGKVYGSMLLGIEGGKDKVAEAVEYFSSVDDVLAEEVNENV